MLPPLEVELRKQVQRIGGGSMRPFNRMLAYHMGWGTGGRRQGGKRIRPLLTLLVADAVGGRWRRALPAAAGIELVHNFSLVHDDVQDHSPTRRGRPTLWKLHGIPLAIDAGDALFAIANAAVHDLRRTFDAHIVTAAMGIVERACLDLTKGQFLDLYDQEKGVLTVAGYWEMIDGKTAALLAAAAHLGALLGGASTPKRHAFAEFGQLLGRAFQVRDDILGIWGEEHRTGKSAATDLAEGKLSLPVVFGLAESRLFAHGWRDARVRATHPEKLRDLLDNVAAREFAVRHATLLTDAALKKLDALLPKREDATALRELATALLTRTT